MIKKIVKMIGLTIGGIILLLLIIGVLFVNLSPEFGGKHSKKDVERYSTSDNYKEGKFENIKVANMDMSFSQTMGTLVDFIKGTDNSKPDFELPVEKVDSLSWEQNDSTDRLFWFGHSSFLLKLDGKNILLDPMLGEVPAPHPWLGGKRYSKELPIEIQKLPRIDVVLISHDHYDHLDYGSIQLLKEKVNQFMVPLGVGAHLREWGVDESSIQEFDWWQELTYENIELAFTPSRHFSGRGLTDRFSTLWGSWVIKGKAKNLYFSGDSGYGKHFKEIGEKFGPFDFAMMECGQYNEKWADIHMMPEETVQASADVNTKKAMPIHWGAFTLALHTWTDPVERFTKRAKQINLNYIIPKIGEEIDLNELEHDGDTWWKN
ncbi:MAG: L-ascorbate metabolism protein UlaG (beta-lactamase superfamily) [Vicingaceae bacterium]|jgi:L-ascorbate metabolism protein UlaG (beta-lactamase superfamily)